jgi:HEAT repeat protein
MGKEGIDALMSVTDSGVQKDTDTVVELFLGLRTKRAFDVLPRLLDNVHVTREQQAELIASAARYRTRPPVSLEPIVAYVAKQKATIAVRKAMLEALAAPGTTKGEKAEAFALEMLKDKADEVRIAAAAACGALKLTKASAPLAAIAKDGKASLVERSAALVALGDIGGKEAEAVLDAPPAKGLERATREGWSRLRPKEAAAKAEAWLTNGEEWERRLAVGVLAANAAGAKRAAQALLKGDAPGTEAEVLEALDRWGEDEEALGLARRIGSPK